MRKLVVPALLMLFVALVPAAGPAAAAPVTQSSGFTCTHVIGFSQTREWYLDSTTFEPIVGDAQWQLLWANGASIDMWADPNFSGWFQPINSACAQGSSSPDRALLTLLSSSLMDGCWSHLTFRIGDLLKFTIRQTTLGTSKR